MKRRYFDHAAATPISESVLIAMAPYWSEISANPSAIHKEGVMAHKAVEVARVQIAKALGVLHDEIIFTASATESVNLALFGSVSAWQKAHEGEVAHIIVSAIEHEAVLSSARILEEHGVLISRITVDANGFINPNDIKDAITANTVLVAVMYANNEIGTIEPIKEIAKQIRKWKKDVRAIVRSEKIEGDAQYPLLYTDACQATNYLDLAIPQLGVDMMTINAAKIYGPKGIALLCKRRDISLAPVMFGGGQEQGFRAGTENVPLIIGFASALSEAIALREPESLRLTVIRDTLIKKLQDEITGIVINGSLTERLPNNINFSLPDIDHEFLALALDARGFAVSTKSACNETDADISHVLLALKEGGGKEHPVSGIRLTMGRVSTFADTEDFVAVLKEILSTMFVKFS